MPITLPGWDTLEVEHDGRVGGEGRLLLQEHPQDGRGGREDDLGVTSEGLIVNIVN